MFLENQLKLDRCPHCQVAKPLLDLLKRCRSKNGSPREWGFYECSNCGGMIMGTSPIDCTSFIDVSEPINAIWPTPQTVDETIPERARDYLTQAIASIHAPAGSVILTAMALEAMLKDKGYKDGSMYARIKAAVADHLITAEMADWAHEVRLDANEQRHVDDDAPSSNEADASKAIKFALALAEFLYVLPARVARDRRSDGK